MKIRLPKDLRGVQFSRVLSIELNDFDIDLFLPALFFKILAEGRNRAGRPNPSTAIPAYIDALARHPDVEGFDDPAGRRVLERLVYSTLIITGRVGRARRGEQILSTVPYTLLSHKAGFPTEASRQRRVDSFVYYALRDYLSGYRKSAAKEVRDQIKIIFGQGVNIFPLDMLGGEYDGSTELDTLARLSIAFLDGMNSTPAGQPSRSDLASSACPRLANSLARDLWKFLFTYYDLMPSQAFTYNVLALLNFELFTFTLKLVHAVNALVANPVVLPPAMGDKEQSSPPDLYLDFTGQRAGLSYDMAIACVQRDIEAYQQFFGSNLLLRQLNNYAEALGRNRTRKVQLERLLEPIGPESSYLQALLSLQDDPVFGPELQASARYDENRIRHENLDEENSNDPDALAWLDHIAEAADTDVGRVVALLTEGQLKKSQSFIQWFKGTGGLLKPHGVLTGTVSARQTWRYAPSNDLLAVLVQLAATSVHEGGGTSKQGVQIFPIHLKEFLDFLERRFGILVDRPPAPFEGADYAAAARENLRALERRLRQMGMFRDLSDDFTVQRLHPPYLNTHAIREKA